MLHIPPLMTDEDNVLRFPLERVDRVAKLAQALYHTLTVPDGMPDAELLAALSLVQVALQQNIMREQGVAALNKALIEANERRRQYDVVLKNGG